MRISIAKKATFIYFIITFFIVRIIVNEVAQFYHLVSLFQAFVQIFNLYIPELLNPSAMEP